MDAPLFCFPNTTNLKTNLKKDPSAKISRIVLEVSFFFPIFATDY